MYTDAVLSNPNAVKIEPFIFYDIFDKCLYMPWATNLLPHEIEENKKELMAHHDTDPCIYWIGTVGSKKYGNINELSPFIKACTENHIDFVQRCGVDTKENIRLIKQSYLAPAIVGAWQKEKGYIPCRIFKNISYGKMGVTNSLRVWELFEKKIVFCENTYQLFYDAENVSRTASNEEMHWLMDFVMEKHTYINRIETLLDFCQLIKRTYGQQI